MLLTAKFVIFLCSVISQSKTVALDRWHGKWNHLSMMHRLTTGCVKNYCNRTLIVFLSETQHSVLPSKATELWLIQH